MGWGNCGTDSKGRPIGYVFEATCDHPGCNAKIDRGLSYACENMHGFVEHGCDGYFCEDHLTYVCTSGDMEADDAEGVQLCTACAKAFEEAPAL